MGFMSETDHLALDGHLLALLVAVYEEGSVTRAAQRLGTTQSAVSHALDKLRGVLGDALFVRSGRGIVATARTEVLVQQARGLLDGLQRLVTSGGFDPAQFHGQLTVAANDLQRDLLLPAVLARLRRQAPGLRLRVLPSGVPSPELLRDGDCHLVLTPRPPLAADLMQKRLFEDRHVVFYDAQQRPAPQTLDDYLAAEHVTVVYHPHRTLDIDQDLLGRGVQRRFVATVPGYAGVPAFLRGQPWLATAPSLLARWPMQGLAWVAPPLPCPPLPMYAVWHLRQQQDPLHQWLRQTLESVAATLGATEPADKRAQPGPGAGRGD